MATDALSKAIDTYHDYMRVIGQAAEDDATKAASAAPTMKIPQPDTLKGKTR